MHTRKSSTLDAQILHVLMDGEIHKQGELAGRFEVHRTTIFNAVERLRIVFIIHSFKGGSTFGGIYLDEQHIYFGLQRKTK